MEAHPDVVGREREAEILAAFLDAVPDGMTALLIEGETGIGKTTLWRSALDAAASRGHRVLTARPVQSEAQLAFTALGDLLEPVLEDALPALPEPQARALDVALLRAEAGDRPPEQRAVSMAALGVLRAASAAAPLVVGIDDLQWIDPASARVLEFAVRRLGPQPVAFVASVRSEKGDPSALGLTRELPPERFHRLALGPLDADALGALIDTRLGMRLARPTLLQLVRTSGGNPFFALEIARALGRWGADPAAGPSGAIALPVPDTLRELVLDRLAALPEDARRVLLAVAALSHPTWALVEAAAGRDRAASALAAASEAGVVTVEDGLIRFTHSLLGSALYGDASPDVRREVHRRLAAVVASAEERARHLALAAAGPDEEVASALEEAAVATRGRGTPDAAAELAELSTSLTPRGREEDRRRRATRAAEYLLEAGGTARARRLLEEVVAAAPRGAARADALSRLALVRYFEDDVREATSLLERALEDAEGDAALEAGIHEFLYWMRALLGDLRAAEPHALASLERAEAAGDPALLARALTAVADHRCLTGQGVAEDLLERAMALERSAELRVDESPAMALASQLTWANEFGRARTLLLELWRRAQERGDESSLPDVFYWLTRLEVWAGDWAAAERYAREGLEVAVQSGQETSRAVLLYCRALVDAHLGRVEPAREAARAASALAGRTGAVLFETHVRAALGFLELSLGNAAGAHEALGGLPELADGIGLREPGVLRFAPDEAEALVALGELDAAEALMADLDERGRRLGRSWAVAAAARGRALVLAGRGEPELALAEAKRAVGLHEGLGQPFELGRALLVAGSIERRHRRWRAARESLQRAGGLFERLGAALWAERAREELARVGGRAPAGEGLTPTEERVARLVAEGRTNQEVAGALFMTVKTVETNLSRVYRKLGVRSRTELARRFAART